MSAGIIIDVSDVFRAAEMVSRLASLDEQELMTNVAALGESQTRRRIESEKTAPDGAPWAPNIEGTSILRRTGRHLLDSVASDARGSVAEWGASWEFAHVHQYGAKITPKNAAKLSFVVAGQRVSPTEVIIPARPFVGISAENAREIEELVSDFVGGLLQ